jgi:sugar phosphate isomerase/epimerase
MPSRRHFIQLATSAAALPVLAPAQEGKESLFKISLAEWSLNRSILKKPGGGDPIDHLDFAKVARSLGIDGIEYVNQMFADKAKDSTYLNEMKKRADAEGVKSLLIMIDREGQMGDPDNSKRAKAVDNHLKWLDAAAHLGCHSIRVNAGSDARLSAEEQKKFAADGLHALSVEAEKRKLYIVVENHGGMSSNGLWLSEVMKLANHPSLGILPDFGNFYTDRNKGELYNPYKGVREFMPWVKQAVSAKAYDWNTGAGKYYTEDRREGREMSLDFQRLIEIVVKSGYRGYIGIEHEGEKHSEIEGIKLTKQILEELRSSITI